MLDEGWGAPMDGPLPADAVGVWRVSIGVTVPDVAVADRWGDMTIELLPGVLAIRTTGISEGGGKPGWTSALRWLPAPRRRPAECFGRWSSTS